MEIPFANVLPFVSWPRLWGRVVSWPRIEGVTLADHTLHHTLINGTGRMHIECSAKTHFTKHLLVDDNIIYQLPYNCGTCESIFKLLSFPQDEARSSDVKLREVVKNVARLGKNLVTRLAPLLQQLPDGNYLLRLLDTPVEIVSTHSKYWMSRRYSYRINPADRDAPEVADEAVDATDDSWFRPHLQVPEAAQHSSDDGGRSYGVFLPTADIHNLNTETVAGHAAAIERGEQPLALCLTWVERRLVAGQFPEHTLFNLVLDGHHKLAAYAQTGRPARVLCIARLEDSAATPDLAREFLLAAMRDLANKQSSRSAIRRLLPW